MAAAAPSACEGGTQMTTGCMALLALISGHTVSYLYMHRLIALHGQPGLRGSSQFQTAGGRAPAAATTRTEFTGELERP